MSRRFSKLSLVVFCMKTFSKRLSVSKKSGRIPRTPLEYAGFQWTPLDSSRNKDADLALVTPRHSLIPGVSGGTCGGVYSPPKTT